MAVLPKGSAPEPDTTQTRYDDLLEVATWLFGEHGYQGTTVRMIADEMGVKSGSLYSHIKKKEDVLCSIVLACSESLKDAALAALASEDTPEGQLRAVCRAHLRVQHDKHAAVTVYFKEWDKLDAESRAHVVMLRWEYDQLFTAIIERGIEQGDFQTPNVRALVLVMLSALNWVYTWYSPEGALTPEEIADQFVDVTLAGLRPRSSA